MDARLAQHYNDKYEGERDDSVITPMPLRNPLPDGRTEAALAVLPDLVEGKDVLEIGAGSGLIPESLRVGGSGFRTWTVGELSEPRLSGLRRNLTDDRFRFCTVDGDRPLDSEQPESYDVVVTMDVIEHLIDPIVAMSQTRELLRPDGVVYLNTPNVARWTHRVQLAMGRFPSTASTNEGLTSYYGGDVDILDDGHFHYFTFRSLTLMLTERCGYSRVEAAPYHTGPGWLGRKLGTRLAHARPQLFSGLGVLAYR